MYFIYKSSGEAVSNKKSAENAVYWSMSFFAGIFLFSSLFFGTLYTKRDQNKFEVANAIEQKSKELSLIKALGKQNDVYIRYGNKNTSWANTRLVIPNSSGASLSIQNGYCGLNYTDGSISNLKSILVKNIPKDDLKAQKIDIAKITIMVHELGHCLDMKRDFATFNLDKIGENKSPILGNKAIAPKLRNNIVNMESYVDAGAKSESILWKEAFADLYSIGYLYVNHNAIADQVAQNLTQYREKHKNGDEEHATSCWLKLVRQSEKPINNKHLVEWADNIRNNKLCEVS